MNFLEKYTLKIILIIFSMLSYSITAETKKLLILGDSISAGYGMKASENWVSLLEKNLNDTLDDDYILINSSISGDTSSGGLSRIRSVLEVHSPDFVLIELGGNDALRGYPIDSIKLNLETIVQETLIKKSKPILMQIRIPPNYGKAYVSAFEDLYPSISDKYKIPLINFMLENVALDKSLMQLDGIHPNRKAQPFIAEFVKKELLQFLE